MNSLLNFLSLLSFWSILSGIIISFALNVKTSPYKACLIVLVPFYIFHHIFQMPDSPLKKSLGILTMGGAIIYLFTSLFLLLLMPSS